MGCDIHFRVEYLARPETLTVREGSLAVTPDGEEVWTPAETTVPHSERRHLQAVITEALAKDPAADISEELDEMECYPLREVPFSALYYSDRNYRVFERLSGVRGDEKNSMMVRPYGLPEDCSAEIAEELSEDNGDLHSHTWYTLTELNQADWVTCEGAYDDWFDFRQTLLSMEVLALEKCGGDTDRVRAVMAYDN